jgi:hypothetical protein
MEIDSNLKALGWGARASSPIAAHYQKIAEQSHALISTVLKVQKFPLLNQDFF